MSDFNVRSDSVNVEQIMEQIRARIREKRGVDYTEQQLREIAAVKLDKFLDPRGVRSDLLEQFKRRQPPANPSFTFEDTTIYESHRGFLRFMRRLLNPILKLFFNPGPIIHALHTQANLNAVLEKQRTELDALYYEVIHNLVLETTRLGIETKNLKMRVESISSRLEFNERRARALESVVAYKASNEEESRTEAPAAAPRQPSPMGGATGASGAVPPAAPPTPSAFVPGPASSAGQPGVAGADGPGQRSRRRRRRRGRRGGGSAVSMMAPGSGQPSSAPAPSEAPPSEAPTSETPSDQHAPAPESTAPGTDTDPQ